MRPIFTLLALLLALTPLAAMAQLAPGARYYDHVAFYPSPPSYATDLGSLDNPPAWMDTPVHLIYVDGIEHRMHFYQGYWYDEAWIPGYTQARGRVGFPKNDAPYVDHRARR